MEGKFVFFGSLLFFPGVVLAYLLIEFGDSSSNVSSIISVLAGMMIIIGLPLLLFAGSLLFKNRRVI